MMRYVASLVWCLCCLATSLAHANNNYFLPGDAFFPTVLTAESLAKLQAAKPAEFRFTYSNFGAYEGAFCGYAGYYTASIPAVDRPFLANLAKVYANIRTGYRKELIEFEDEGKLVRQETNGVRVLFYPEKFEFPRYKLGLQYNENWVEEIEKFGHRAEHMHLGELVDSKDAIIQSWRDSTKVGSFELTLPKFDKEADLRDWDPVVLKGAVKAIVVPPVPLKDFFAPEKYLLTPIYVVDAQRIERYELDAERGVWKIAKEGE